MNTSPDPGSSSSASKAAPGRITGPDEAVEALVLGNERFLADSTDHPNHEAARRRGADGQHPFAAIVRCADSRVAPELVFDRTLGELFVCGVAGNVPTPEVVASLEYAVEMLETPLVVVMGHSGCGAVQAAIDHAENPDGLPGHLPDLIRQVLPACTETAAAAEHLSAAVERNVRNGMKRIADRSTLIAAAVEAGRCRIAGGVYDLTTGRFDFIQD